MSGPLQNSVLILGAGHAAGAVAIALRQFGHVGPITMVGEEPAPPYQRPPLSKAYFKGELGEERLYLKPKEFYAAQNIELKLNTRAVALDRAARQVRTDAGEMLGYDKLIIATGSRARALPLPGADLRNVLVLRTLEDVDRLRPLAVAGKRLVVVGAGYIGLEAAAVARALDLQVTVLEAADRVLARVTGPVVSEFFQDMHRTEGVDVRLGARMEGLVGTDKVTGVQMVDGEVIPADIVLVGIGILPNEDIAAEAGITCDNGIVTDADARTSDPDVFAVGDCASRPIALYGLQGRLESVHNALEMAKLAAAAICGQARPPLDTPWFWSDQYDVKLQTAGLSTGFDQVVLRGDVAARKFSVWYLRAGAIIAVDAVNMPAEFLAGKKLVGMAARLDPAQLSDLGVDMKSLIGAAQG